MEKFASVNACLVEVDENFYISEVRDIQAKPTGLH